MSNSHVPPAPDDDSSAESFETDISAETAEKTGIQVDLYGIKAHVQPVETGEPTPKTWADVGQAVNAKLKSIAVNLPGLVDDMIVGGRKLVRGLAQIPAALARRIDRAHEKADRVEAVRQEKMEAGSLPPPAAEDTIDRLESLLLDAVSEPSAVDVRIDNRDILCA
jgi:hypothetical protein